MKAGRTIAGIAGFLGGRKLRREEIREVADADMRATTQQLSGAFADAFKQCADRWAVRATAVADREIRLADALGTVAVLAHALARRLQQKAHGFGFDETFQLHPTALLIVRHLFGRNRSEERRVGKAGVSTFRFRW